LVFNSGLYIYFFKKKFVFSDKTDQMELLDTFWVTFYVDNMIFLLTYFESNQIENNKLRLGLNEYPITPQSSESQMGCS